MMTQALMADPCHPAVQQFAAPLTVHHDAWGLGRSAQLTFDEIMLHRPLALGQVCVEHVGLPSCEPQCGRSGRTPPLTRPCAPCKYSEAHDWGTTFPQPQPAKP